MGLFDTLKKAAKTAEQLAGAVQKLEHVADPAQHPAEEKTTAQSPQPAAASAPEKRVGYAAFPQDPQMPGSRERQLEGWYCGEDNKDHELRYCFSCPPGFLPWETEALFSIAYVPDCTDEYAPEVLGGKPYIALNIDSWLSAFYLRFLEEGRIDFDTIEETGNPRMPHRSMCRIQGGRFIMRAYHLDGILGTEDCKEYALHVCYPANLKGTQTEQMLWTALDQVAATFREVPVI